MPAPDKNTAKWLPAQSDYREKCKQGKYKSFLFLEQESKQLDSGEVDTETEES